jgi:O-antigen/teichoic acid export membrane protein
MKYLSKIFDQTNISKKFTQNVFYLLIANGVNNGTIFIVNLVIARKCGPEMFGLFSVSVNVALFALAVSEFGMNYTMIRFYADHKDSPVESKKILLVHLYFKSIVLCVLGVVSLIAGGLIARFVLHDDRHGMLVGIALICGGILGFWSYFRAFFQIHGRFQTIAGLTVVYAILRLVLLSIVFSYSSVPAPEYLLVGVYVLPLSVVLLSGFSSLRKTMPSAVVRSCDLWKTAIESISYSKWVALTGLSFMLIQQSMVFIVASLGGIKQAALLNAGLVFTAVFSMINDAVRQVLYPDVAGYHVDRLVAYRQRILRMVPLMLVGAAFIIGILSLVMDFALGQKYHDSLSIFWITGFGTAATSCIGFYTLTAHTIKRPQIDALVNCSSLFVFVTVGIFLMKYANMYAVVITYAMVILTGELIKMCIIKQKIQVVTTGCKNVSIKEEQDYALPNS